MHIFRLYPVCGPAQLKKFQAIRQGRNLGGLLNALRKCSKFSTCTVSKALVSLVILGVMVSGCSTLKKVIPGGDPDVPPTASEKRRQAIGTVSGNEKGFVLFGGKDDSRRSGAGNIGISVNAYLWKATLDTLSFMPLASADPFGGTILTDWYSLPETPTERFKVNALVLDSQLRSDALKISVFRQQWNGQENNGAWGDQPVDGTTARQLESAILTKARELRQRDVLANN